VPLLQVLSAPRRRELLRLTWDRETSAGDLHRAFDDGVTFGAISQHLRVLAEAGLVDVRRDGRRRLYRARREALGELRTWLEASWATALDRLKLRAELEAARRGPRPRKPKPSRRRKP
jgi:DNA-binding transcriptional ArsR family regulator